MMTRDQCPPTPAAQPQSPLIPLPNRTTRPRSDPAQSYDQTKGHAAAALDQAAKSIKDLAAATEDPHNIQLPPIPQFPKPVPKTLEGANQSKGMSSPTHSRQPASSDRSRGFSSTQDRPRGSSPGIGSTFNGVTRTIGSIVGTLSRGFPPTPERNNTPSRDRVSSTSNHTRDGQRASRKPPSRRTFSPLPRHRRMDESSPMTKMHSHSAKLQWDRRV